MHARKKFYPHDRLRPPGGSAANDNIAPDRVLSPPQRLWRRVTNDPAAFALYLLLMSAAVTVGYSAMGFVALWWLG